MEYRKYIRQLVADILNNKGNPEDIKNPRDFFYVESTLLRMGKLPLVKSMGEIAGKRNKNGGWQYSK